MVHNLTKVMLVHMYGDLTSLVIKYCKLVDGKRNRNHSDWCEYQFHYCDCGLQDWRDEQERLMEVIKQMKENS